MAEPLGPALELQDRVPLAFPARGKQRPEPLRPTFSWPQVPLAGAQCPPGPPGTSGSLWWAENNAREMQMAAGEFEPRAEWREGPAVEEECFLKQKRKCWL